MSDAERYVRWTPLGDDMPLRWWRDELVHDSEWLVVTLRPWDKPGLLRIRFRDFIAYRNVAESYTVESISRHGPVSSSLSIVEHSTWIAWVVNESGGILEADKLIHYAIYTVDDTIDIAARLEPTVEWFDGA